VLLEAVLKIHLHSRHLLEQLLLQDSHLSLQMVYTHHQEQQAVLVMEIHQFLNCSPISEQHPHQELVHQITLFYIQILELLKVLVRRLPEMKQRFFTHMSEMHLQTAVELQHQKKRALSSEQYPQLEMVLQHQKNCEPSLEPVLHQAYLTRLYLLDTEKSEQPMGTVALPLTMKLSVCIPRREMRAEQEMALQVRLHLRPH
jgi:hypothetical protein